MTPLSKWYQQVCNKFSRGQKTWGWIYLLFFKWMQCKLE